MKTLPITESSTKILAMNLDRISALKAREFIEKHGYKPLRRNIYVIEYWQNPDEKILDSMKANGVILYERPIENTTNHNYCYFLRTGNHLLYAKINEKPKLDEQTIITVERHCGEIFVEGKINVRQSTYHFDIINTSKKSFLKPLPKGNVKLFSSPYDFIEVTQESIVIDGLEKIIGNL